MSDEHHDDDYPPTSSSPQQLASALRDGLHISAADDGHLDLQPYHTSALTNVSQYPTANDHHLGPQPSHTSALINCSQSPTADDHHLDPQPSHAHNGGHNEDDAASPTGNATDADFSASHPLIAEVFSTMGPHHQCLHKTTIHLTQLLAEGARDYADRGSAIDLMRHYSEECREAALFGIEHERDLGEEAIERGETENRPLTLAEHRQRVEQQWASVEEREQRIYQRNADVDQLCQTIRQS
jgi:hypothetical protein